MSEGGLIFNRGAVRPVECLKAGWQLIRADYWLFLGITFVGVLLAGLVPFGILMGPALCGVFLCLLRRERGWPVTFDMLLRGFDYFAQSLIATLLVIVPMVLIFVVFYLVIVGGTVAVFASAASQNPGEAPATLLIVALIAGYVLLVLGMSLAFMLLWALLLFTYSLIVDRGLSGVQALRLGFRAVVGNFGGILGLVLLAWVIGLVGALACYVGAYFVMPVSYAMFAVAYRQVFPADGSVLFRPTEPDWPEPSAPHAGPDETGIRGVRESPFTATSPPPSEPGIQRSDEAPGPA